MLLDDVEGHPINDDGSLSPQFIDFRIQQVQVLLPDFVLDVDPLGNAGIEFCQDLALKIMHFLEHLLVHVHNLGGSKRDQLEVLADKSA